MKKLGEIEEKCNSLLIEIFLEEWTDAEGYAAVTDQCNSLLIEIFLERLKKVKVYQF